MKYNLSVFAIIYFLTFHNAWADLSGKVIRILDGDTIDVLIADDSIRIRLSGIDAPEKKQPFGQRSKKSLTELVSYKNVKIVQAGKDHYGRVLGVVFLDDWNINQEQVRRGMAWAYRYRGQPIDQSMASLETEAKIALRGLWSVPSPIEPWEWRNNAVLK